MDEETIKAATSCGMPDLGFDSTALTGRGYTDLQGALRLVAIQADLDSISRRVHAELTRLMHRASQAQIRAAVSDEQMRRAVFGHPAKPAEEIVRELMETGK